MKFKKYFWLSFLAILISVFSSSCKDSGSPESITELFLISLNQLDYQTMNSISTRNTKEIIKIMQTLTKDKLSEEELEERAGKLKISILNTRYLNDSTAHVHFHTEPQLLPIDKIQLVKVLEKLDKVAWKIDISTVDLLETESIEIEEDLGNRQSSDGQMHPDADSIAVEE